MTLLELIPEVKKLATQDKFALARVLESDLEQIDPKIFENLKTIPFWSFSEQYEAAAVLQKMLDDEKAAP